MGREDPVRVRERARGTGRARRRPQRREPPSDCRGRDLRSPRDQPLWARLLCPENGGPVRSLAVLRIRSEEHTSELQSLAYLVCRLLLEKKKKSRLRTC